MVDRYLVSYSRRCPVFNQRTAKFRGNDIGRLSPSKRGCKRDGDLTKATHGRIVCHTVQNTCPYHLRTQRRRGRLVAVTSLCEKDKKSHLDEPSFEMGASALF